MIEFYLLLSSVWRGLFIVLGTLASFCQTSAQLRLENLALRHQLAVLRRSPPKHLQLTPPDRIFWVGLRQVWADWKSTLLIVQAETVVAWRRKGFLLFWRRKVRSSKPRRPRVLPEVRDLIRMMSRHNLRWWGAPRIHGELLKLDMEIIEPTVSKSSRVHQLRAFLAFCRHNSFRTPVPPVLTLSYGLAIVKRIGLSDFGA